MALLGKGAENALMGVLAVTGSFFVVEPRVDWFDKQAAEQARTPVVVVEPEPESEIEIAAVEPEINVDLPDLDLPVIEVPEEIRIASQDLIRFDGETAVISGTADAGANIVVLDQDNQIASGIAGGNGDFALAFNYAIPENGAILHLGTEQSDGSVLRHGEPITILPRVGGDAITAELTTEGVEVNAPQAGTELALSSVAYGDTDAATIAGTGAVGSIIDVLINGNKVGEAEVGENGKWQFDTTELAVGAHKITLQTGDTEPVETQIVRAEIVEPIVIKAPESAPRVEVGDAQYTVVKGDSLWRIARQHLGEGIRYVDIYNANRELIDNPDMIFPGQEFVIQK